MPSLHGKRNFISCCHIALLNPSVLQSGFFCFPYQAVCISPALTGVNGCLAEDPAVRRSPSLRRAFARPISAGRELALLLKTYRRAQTARPDLPELSSLISAQGRSGAGRTGESAWVPVASTDWNPQPPRCVKPLFSDTLTLFRQMNNDFLER